MNRLRKLTVIALLIAILVVLVAPTAAKVTVVFLSDGDPSQWGVEELLTRKVNEYEGQHRIASDPSQWGFEATRKVNEYEGQH
ncbi:MAG: hypothetical protein HZC41_18505 [Chloroflexi bacterium]|nr:hypothetical protein [Chloroflexota bacterium]